MKCPNCDTKLTSASKSIIDTRPVGDTVRRRRVCRACGNKFTTYETPAAVSPAGRASFPRPDNEVATKAIEHLQLATTLLGTLVEPSPPQRGEGGETA